MSFSNNFPTTSPSLELDFANVGALDPRITFTRSSIATVTNSLGLLQTVQANVPRFDYDPVTLAPRGLLIEEARTNLLLRSEEFDNTVWVKVATCNVLANTTVAPSGAISAETINFPAVGDGIYQSTASTNIGTTYTATVWLWAASAGTITIKSPGAGLATLVANVTTTPTRFSITYTATVANEGIYILRDTAGQMTSLYAWGAQLEAGSFATSYVPSTQTFTGRTSTGTFIGSNGLIQTAGVGVARMQYNPTNLNAQPFLLLEAAATNLQTYSEQFDNVAGWGVTNATISINSAVSPDGLSTADKLIDDATNGVHRSISSFTPASTTPHTLSFFAKQSGRNWIAIGNASDNQFAYFNLASGVIGSLVGGATASIQALTNGWYRCSVTFTPSSTTGKTFGFYLASADGTASYVGDGTSGAFIWGAQLETGSYATSYIPTVATTVTRSADTSTSAATTRNADAAVMTGTAFSSWYNPNQGTLYTEGGGLNAASSARLASITDNTFSNRIINYFATSGLAAGLITTSGVSQANPVVSITSATALNKVIQGYALNNVNIAANGTLGTLDTSATIPAVTLMRIGVDEVGTGSFLNGTIRKIAYYPVRLTDAQLQALTL